MRRILVIEDHGGFQRAVARTVLAGGALALLTALIAVPPWAAALIAVPLLAMAITLPLGLQADSTGWLDRTGLKAVAWMLLCGVLAGAANRLLAGRMPQGAELCTALCLGLAVAQGDLPRWQKVLTMVSGFLLCWGGARVPQALAAQGVVQALPAQAGVLLGGLGMGLVVGSVAIVRRLRVKIEPVDGELLSLLPPVSGEHGDLKGPPGAVPMEKDDEIARLLHRSVATFRQAAEALIEYPEAAARAENLVKKIARFGRRWREIEAEAGKSDRTDLCARIEDLRRRQEATSDEQARAEYERALTALASQLSYLDEIERGRERAVARLHHQVAILERLRLAAIRYRSADAAKMGEELRAVIEDIGSAGTDLDSAAEALAELG